MNIFGIAEQVDFIKGLAPAADRWNTGPATDIVRMSYHNYLMALIHQEGGTTGKATITVEACSNVSASATTAVAFKYRVGGAAATAGTGDTTGAWTDATTAGFDTTAGEEHLYLILVSGAAIAATGYSFVRIKTVEAANDPVNGYIDLLLCESRYAGAVQPSVLA